jgi:hypothetical protein
MRFSNPRGEVTRVKFRVKFELSDKPREPAAPSR